MKTHAFVLDFDRAMTVALALEERAEKIRKEGDHEHDEVMLHELLVTEELAEEFRTEAEAMA